MQFSSITNSYYPNIYINIYSWLWDFKIWLFPPQLMCIRMHKRVKACYFLFIKTDILKKNKTKIKTMLKKYKYRSKTRFPIISFHHNIPLYSNLSFQVLLYFNITTRCTCSNLEWNGMAKSTQINKLRKVLKLVDGVHSHFHDNHLQNRQCWLIVLIHYVIPNNSII